MQDVAEALRRLPPDVIMARNARLRRATDLDMKHDHLHGDLLAKQTPGESYLQVRAGEPGGACKTCDVRAGTCSAWAHIGSMLPGGQAALVILFPTQHFCCLAFSLHHPKWGAGDAGGGAQGEARARTAWCPAGLHSHLLRMSGLHLARGLALTLVSWPVGYFSL